MDFFGETCLKYKFWMYSDVTFEIIWQAQASLIRHCKNSLFFAKCILVLLILFFTMSKKSEKKKKRSWWNGKERRTSHRTFWDRVQLELILDDVRKLSFTNSMVKAVFVLGWIQTVIRRILTLAIENGYLKYSRYWRWKLGHKMFYCMIYNTLRSAYCVNTSYFPKKPCSTCLVMPCKLFLILIDGSHQLCLVYVRENKK